MEITLEKIELVKDRTGVSYKEAKEALEEANGSVVDAIIAIEETIDEMDKSGIGEKGGELLENLKAAIKKGNVTKIVVKKNDEVLLNMPLNIGIVGTVIAPIAVVAGVIAAFGTKCTIEIVKDDGEVVEISEIANETFDEVKEKGSAMANEVKSKGTDFFESAKEKANEAINKAKRNDDDDDDDDDDDAIYEDNDER